MQGNISSITNEKDLAIKYGMINYWKERDLARACVKDILKDANDIKCSYIRLGFHLHEFDKNEYYMDFGYSSLFDFCDANIGMDKSAVSRCISVFLNFSARQNGSRMLWIDEKYQDYSYSQLCEMASMRDHLRLKVKPEMTVKQIRDLKKENALQSGKNVSRSDKNVSHVATSQQNAFNYDDFYKYKGAVLSNWIKKLAYDDVKHLSLYDQNGKEIYSFLTCDVLCMDDNNLILRVFDPEKEETPGV